MRRKILTSVFFVIAITTTLFSSVALADANKTTVTLQGYVTVIPGLWTSTVQMSLKSTDATAWSLDVTLHTSEIRSEDGDDKEERESHAISAANVSGPFALRAQQQTLATGTAIGQLKTDGSGTMTLSDKTSSTAIDISFFITWDGMVTVTATGQWPSIPASLASPPAATVTQAPTQVTASVPAATTAVSDQSATPPAVNHVYWYLSRTSALVAYLLLFINFCLGILLKTRRLDSMMERWRVYEIHQFTAILSGVLIMFHVLSLLGDAYFKFSLTDLFVPMASPYKPLWTSLGILGFYGIVIVIASFYICKLIKKKTWRVLHFISYLIFPLVLFHGIKAGSDTSTLWVQWMYIVTGAIAASLFLWRIFGYSSVEKALPQLADQTIKVKEPSKE